MSLLLAAAGSPGVLVLVVADGELLALVAGETDGLADVCGDRPFVAAFTEEGVDGLDLVPAWRGKEER